MNEQKIPNFIEALYYGKIRFFDHPYQPGSPHSQKVSHMLEAWQHLEKTLTPQQKELFDHYSEAESNVEASDQLTHFSMGFRLGCQCVYDIFMNTKTAYDAP